MSSPSWLSSPRCSININQSSESISLPIQLLRFIFLSPCPQRIIFSAIDVLFLLTIIGFSVQKLCSKFVSKSETNDSINKPLLETRKPLLKITPTYYLSLVLTAVLAICSSVLCVLAFVRGTKSPWQLVEALFWLIQAITHMVILTLIAHEKRFKAIIHPLSLRIYWVLNFVMVTLLIASGIARLTTFGGNINPALKIDDICSFVFFPISVSLFIIAVRGSSGIVSQEPKISSNSSEAISVDLNASGYGTASWFSKLTWNWLNPLLAKGYKSPLKMDDVPSLAPDHRAEKMSVVFEKIWSDQEENTKNRLRTTLLLRFWKDITFTGVLALIKLVAIYVGPLLINSFVSYTSGDRSNKFEGYYLVLILLVSKLVEVLTSHHFTFHTQKLGMLIRCTIITTLYKKGLRLSCSSRQTHGVGQIVSHMSVDAQQLADLMTQLHSLWLMPIQISVALALLYVYMGLSMLAALVAVIVILIFSFMSMKTNNGYQSFIMRNRDLRLKATNEMLSNMRVIKFQAWEEHFDQKVRSFRDKEYSWLSKFTYAMSWTTFVLWSMPQVMSVLIFGIAVLVGTPLDTGTVFTATTILRIIQDPIRSFPQALIQVTQAFISLGRLDTFLTSRELDDTSVERNTNNNDEIAVEVREGNFSWDDEGDEVALKNVNLRIKKGELAAIVGTVGSGKSSLLASVLGELHRKSGKVKVNGTTAYVAQTSWIQNATIQENILFGSPMNYERYSEVVRVCSLEKDLEVMDHGDRTEIGERGINLSGGQKQRIQLARAVYQDCDIYLLDDVFSAVDAHTGSEIFKECVRGILKDKTILLVTHQVDFLHNASQILVMRDGMIVQSGKYQELLQSGMEFGDLVAAYETSMELVDVSTPISDNNTNLKTPQSPALPITRGNSHGKEISAEKPKSKTGTSKLIEDEEKEIGSVSFDVYKQYFTEAYGWWGVAVVVIISVFWQVFYMASDFWLAYETSGSTIFNPTLFMGIYALLAGLACTLALARSFVVALLGLKTCQSFFNRIVNSITHAPMSFFDTTPSGRILNRASTDQAALDVMIPYLLGTVILVYFSLFGVLAIMCVNSWPTVVLVVPLVWLTIYLRKYYIKTARELTRLDGITKAPVIHHFSETISGAMTIRCFRKQGFFSYENISRVNANLRMDFHNNASNEWLGFRLELAGTVFLCTATMCMVLLPATVIKPEYVGLTLSYGLILNSVMFYSAYISCIVENKMVSVERIKQFIRIPSEAPWRNSDRLPSPDWPTRGEIEIKDLKVRYRPNTPLVLKDITIHILGGEKIGIVGRTGSGKTTLIQVLFRLVEPSNGKILIDGLDICKLGLHDVRSRFGIIPQDPVLFEGTVRSNMDPLGLYSDEEIWKSLERCQLKDAVIVRPEKLDASVSDSGDNFSVGQRQLLCLGRVMLKRSKILFLDEATASIDSQTDSVVQKIIREEFSKCTIISIAHRITTVMDCDRVLVMDAGRVNEFDAPSRLLERPSLFQALVQEYTSRSDI